MRRKGNESQGDLRAALAVSIRTMFAISDREVSIWISSVEK